MLMHTLSSKHFISHHNKILSFSVLYVQCFSFNFLFFCSWFSFLQGKDQVLSIDLDLGGSYSLDNFLR